MYGDYSKGRTVHRTKRKAEQMANEYREDGTPCKVVKVARGYRVDKKY